MGDPPRISDGGDHGDDSSNLELQIQTFMENSVKCMEQMEELQRRHLEANQCMEGWMLDLQQKEDTRLVMAQGSGYSETGQP